MKKWLLTLMLAAALTLAGTSLALAATGEAIPHGGYAPDTDACLQCHDVHEAYGYYVLSRWETVTGTCGSCHNLYLRTTPLPYGKGEPSPLGQYITQNMSYTNWPSTWTTTPPSNFDLEYYDPGYPGTEATPPTFPGTGAPITAYRIDWGQRANHEGHRISIGRPENGGSGPYNFADGKDNYNAGHIPGGSGNLTAIKLNLFPQTVPTTEEPATMGLYCASCHTPHGKFGNMLDNRVSGKILSSMPNHTTPVEFDIGPGQEPSRGTWFSQGGKWCMKCHDLREDKRVQAPGITQNALHANHPETVCLDCHGNYVGVGDPTVGDPIANPTTTRNEDFPHTGAINVLSAYPDELCTNQCHTVGTLP